MFDCVWSPFAALDCAVGSGGRVVVRMQMWISDAKNIICSYRVVCACVCVRACVCVCVYGFTDLVFQLLVLVTCGAGVRKRCEATLDRARSLRAQTHCLRCLLLFSTSVRYSNVYVDSLECATIYRAVACLCLFAYDSADR